MCNDRSTKPVQIVLIREIRCQFDEHVLLIQDFGSLAVDQPIYPQDSNMETVSVRRTRWAWVVLRVVLLVLV